MNENSCPPGQVYRPTFWNIPESLQVALYLLAFVAVALFVYGSWQRHIRLWRRGQGEFRIENLPERLKSLLTYGVATKKVVLENQPAGLMHWGHAYAVVK
jgi:hypothetical protein